jgi:hypothetical protein
VQGLEEGFAQAAVFLQPAQAGHMVQVEVQPAEAVGAGGLCGFHGGQGVQRARGLPGDELVAADQPWLSSPVTR